MKKVKMLQIVSLMLTLCLVSVPSMTVFAEEGESGTGEKVYDDTDQYRYVDDIDEYLAKLNAGLITPVNTTITTYESTVTPLSIISDPSKNCSNIFGHSWGDWGSWSELKTVHMSGGKDFVEMERWRYCNRTHCGASQKETDGVWITCTH